YHRARPPRARHERQHMKLVLDTNVVLDWLVFDDPALNPFRDALRDGRVTILTHAQALDELHHVLSYPKLALHPTRQAHVLERYRAHAVSLRPDLPNGEPTLPGALAQCRDPDDLHFLALAYRGQADMLVSRDKAVLALKRRASTVGLEIVDVPQMIKR